MVWINGTDSLFDPFVECYKSNMLGIGRLVEWVVAGHPSIALIMLYLSQLSPRQLR